MKNSIYIMIVLIVSVFFGFSFAASEYTVDESHTNVGFTVRHMVIAKVHGKFSDYKIELKFDEKNLSGSLVNVEIQTKSVDTDNRKRDDHLISADFFNAVKYPTITFISKKIVHKGEKSYIANGDLTIRGVTKNVDLPFTITGVLVDPWGNSRMGIEAGLTINRQDFGVSWNKTLDNGGFVVSDEVNIKVDAEFLKK